LSTKGATAAEYRVCATPFQEKKGKIDFALLQYIIKFILEMKKLE